MRRVIEDLIEKRKAKQATLKETLEQLGLVIEDTGFFFNKKKKGQITAKLLEFNTQLNDLITIQDKEWDAYSNNHSTGVFKSLQWKVEKLEAEYANVKKLLVNFVSIEQSLDRLIQSIESAAQNVNAGQDGNKNDEINGDALNAAQVTERLKSIKDQLSTYQYSEFEQRFRGDHNDVVEKLKKYVPLYADHDNILDIGCGRGEFMELLKAENKNCCGIDISQSMLQIAQAKGLDCTLTDAQQYLQQQENASLGGIFSAQVIEHLQPEYLRQLVLEAFRVLQPGGPILLETVNPLSLFALSNIYFLDITHQKPLHPEYMRYLLESVGFHRVEVVFSEELQQERLEEIAVEEPIARQFNSNVDKLNKLLYSSPVYAVTGIKP